MAVSIAKGNRSPERLIADLYEATINDSRWESALRGLADICGANGATLFAFDSKAARIPLAITTGIDLDGWKDYDQHYANIDPRIKYVMNVRALDVCHDSDHTSDYEMKHSEYYNWLARYKYRYYMATPLVKDGQLVSFLSIQRTPEQGHVQRRDIELFRRICPHVQRAVQIRFRLALAEAKEIAASEIIDRLCYGVIVLDRCGCVVQLNEKAEEILKRNDGIRLSSDRTLKAHGSERPRLTDLIGGVLGSNALDTFGSGGQVVVRRPGDRQPYTVLVARIPSHSSTFRELSKGAIVFITDPDANPSVRNEAWGQIFGFTSAEILLARHIMEGGSLEEFSEKQRLSIHTTRWRLKHLLGKTDTHRQTQLMRVLSNTLLPTREK